jgi:hypothetical protein
MFSPTCFGRHFGYFQVDVIITGIKTHKFGKLCHHHSLLQVKITKVIQI